LYIAGEKWELLKPLWHELLQLLDRLGFLAPPTKSDRPKGGRPRLKAHQDAIQRLQDEEQSRKSNFYQWKKEYEKETGIDPGQTENGAWELHRSAVWRKNKPDETG